MSEKYSQKDINDEIDFGKYAGHTIKFIIDNHPEYILWAINNIESKLKEKGIFKEFNKAKESWTEEQIKKFGKNDKKILNIPDISDNKKKLEIIDTKINYVQTSDGKYIIYDITEEQFLKIIDKK